MIRGQRRRRVQRRSRCTQGWGWIQGSGRWRWRIQRGKGRRRLQGRQRGLKISSILTASHVSAFTLHLLISIFFSTSYRSKMERRTNKKKLSRNLLDMKVSA